MYKRLLICLLIPIIFLSTTSSAKAGSIPNNGQIAAGIAGAAAGVAVVAVLITYYSVNHNHTLKSCAASSRDGLQLINESDKQTYSLTGDTGLIKPGERVRLSGKKLKTDPSHKQFVVTKVSKTYGACKEMPAPAL